MPKKAPDAFKAFLLALAMLVGAGTLFYRRSPKAGSPLMGEGAEVLGTFAVTYYVGTLARLVFSKGDLAVDTRTLLPGHPFDASKARAAFMSAEAVAIVFDRRRFSPDPAWWQMAHEAFLSALWREGDAVIFMSRVPQGGR